MPIQSLIHINGVSLLNMSSKYIKHKIKKKGFWKISLSWRISHIYYIYLRTLTCHTFFSGPFLETMPCEGHCRVHLSSYPSPFKLPDAIGHLSTPCTPFFFLLWGSLTNEFHSSHFLKLLTHILIILDHSDMKFATHTYHFHSSPLPSSGFNWALTHYSPKEKWF